MKMIEDKQLVLHKGIYKPIATVPEAIFMITGMTIGAGVLGIPYVVTVHHYQKRGAWRRDKHCGGYIAVSESLRENLVNAAHVPKEMIRLIPAGARVPNRKTVQSAGGLNRAERKEEREESTAKSRAHSSLLTPLSSPVARGPR